VWFLDLKLLYELAATEKEFQIHHTRALSAPTEMVAMRAFENRQARTNHEFGRRDALQRGRVFATGAILAAAKELKAIPGESAFNAAGARA
jgi:hypothetical protein